MPVVNGKIIVDGIELPMRAVSEDDKVVEAVSYLEQKLDDVRKQSSVITSQKVALMAAVGLAAEVCELKDSATEVDDTIDKLTERINSLID